MRHRIKLSSVLRRTPAPRLKQYAAALLGAAALAGLPLTHANAAGAVIDFESAPLGPIGSFDPDYGPTLSDVFVSNGFYVGGFSNSPLGQTGDLIGSVVDGSDVYSTCFNMACPTTASNPTQYLTALNDGALWISHTTSTFKVQSFDAAFLGNYDTGTFPATSGILRIQGTTLTGSALTQDFALDGPGADGFEFGHYITSGVFANTEFTEIYLYGYACEASGSCKAFSTNRGQFAIDNIATTAPVPEPATWLMLGAGLLAVGAATRRRRQA
nr:NF038120 family PEP-CTERM protein [uncultured Duganella sp.]